MTTKLKVSEIKDPNTNVEINSPNHRIEEIKAELKTCFNKAEPQTCQAEVLEMWDEKTSD